MLQLQKQFSTSLHRKESAQAAAELALVLPLLCFMALGIISYGQMIWTSMDLTSATRDGARKAAVARLDTTQDPTIQVKNAVKTSLDRTNADNISTTVSGSWVKDAKITVKTELPYQMSIMGVNVWNGPIKSEAQVRIS